MTPFVVRETVFVSAPIARLFQLSTNLALVSKTLQMKATKTAAIGSITSGHIVANSRVAWRGWKFGLPTEHHSLISGFIPPHAQHSRIGDRDVTAEAFFQDTQEHGRFAFFQHDHHFYETDDPTTGTPLTQLSDEVRFVLPFGFLGVLAARFLLQPYIRRLCRKRFARLKSLAEGSDWQPYVDA